MIVGSNAQPIPPALQLRIPGSSTALTTQALEALQQSSMAAEMNEQQTRAAASSSYQQTRPMTGRSAGATINGIKPPVIPRRDNFLLPEALDEASILVSGLGLEPPKPQDQMPRTSILGLLQARPQQAAPLGEPLWAAPRPQ
jgi:hypothetical protein